MRGTGFDALSLHGNSASDALLGASLDLVAKGAGAIVLGCAVSSRGPTLNETFGPGLRRTFSSTMFQGMAPLTADMEKAIANKVGRHIPVIDGVQAAVEMGIGLARMKLRTAGC